MSDPSPADLKDFSSSQSPSGRKIRLLLGLGVGGWLLATLVMVACSWGEFFTIFDTLGRLWPLNFLFGGLVLLFVLAGLGLAKKVDAWTAFSVLGAYFVPVGLLLFGERSILGIWDNPQSRTVFADGLVPLAVYIVSLIAAGVIGRKQASDFLLAFAVPPTVLALVAGVLSAFVVFSSDAFVYRDAFGVRVNSATFEDGELQIDAVLYLRKEGEFGYEAIFYNFENPGFGGNQGTLEWKNGQPSNAGEHPFTLTWVGVNPIRQSGGMDFPESGPNFIIRKSGEKAVFLKSFMLDLPAAESPRPAADLE
jgi:hypothetical protein